MNAQFLYFLSLTLVMMLLSGCGGGSSGSSGTPTENTKTLHFTSSNRADIKENELYVITLEAQGNDNPVVYSISGGDSASFNINTGTGEVTFKTAPDYETKNSYAFTAKASDGTNETTQSVSVTILDVNEIPFFTSLSSVSVKENQFGVITLHAVDEEQTTLNYSISDAGDGLSFEVNSVSGKVTFKLEPDYEAKNFYTFRAQASDGVNTAAQDVSIDITDVEERDKKTGQTKSYDENGVAVVDASVEDDGYFQKGVSLSYSRVSDIVSDALTGLMWQDDAAVTPVTKQWLTSSNYNTCENNTSSPACIDTSGDTAATYCSELNLGGYNDWRLPSDKELEGIVDYVHSSPAIDPVYFHNSGSDVYWSSVSKDDDQTKVWIVYFDHGNVYSSAKNNSFHIRCVREGE